MSDAPKLTAAMVKTAMYYLRTDSETNIRMAWKAMHEDISKDDAIDWQGKRGKITAKTEAFLFEQGLVIVPEVATRAMESAGARDAYGGSPGRAAMCWEAMVKAALEEEYDAKADR